MTMISMSHGGSCNKHMIEQHSLHTILYSFVCPWGIKHAETDHVFIR